MKLADMTLEQLKEYCTKTDCADCVLGEYECSKSPHGWNLEGEVQLRRLGKTDFEEIEKIISEKDGALCRAEGEGNDDFRKRLFEKEVQDANGN